MVDRDPASKYMVRYKKKNILIKMSLVLILLLALDLSLAYIGLTGDSDDSAFTSPRHYPDKFHGTGRIARIAGDEIVIGDSLYKLSSAVTYHTTKIENASSAWFRAGNLVGFITNSEHHIISLWLIE